MSKEKAKGKKPIDEEKMQIKWMGNASLFKIFGMMLTIPTVLVTCTYLMLQNEASEYKVTHKVFFDIEIAGKPQPRVVVGLFGETVPRTVQNFLTFATDGFDGKKYQGTNMHRVLKTFMVIGGDVVNNDGSGQTSIFGPTFADENFAVKHTAAGYISMYNTGPDTNGCQFFISLIPTRYLDEKHVAFGKVVEGFETLETIEMVETDWDMKPFEPVTVVKSGSLKVDEPFMISNDPYNFKEWAQTSIPGLVLVVLMVIGFDQISKRLDRGIEMHDKILKELEDKLAKEEAEAAAEYDKAELMNSKKDEEDKENVRKRNVE